jgi:prepilin-type N-terminal cleavage/methylation domain-containing protein
VGANRETRADAGFTLLEALLSIVLLSLMAAAVGGMYWSGLHAQDAATARALVDQEMRSRMEELLSERFFVTISGSDTVTVDGRDIPISWTVVNVDLDGNGDPEPAAKQITVSIDERSLSTIVVDHQGKVGKL